MPQAPKFSYEQIAEVMVRLFQRAESGRKPDEQLVDWFDTSMANLHPKRVGAWSRAIRRDEMSRPDTELPPSQTWIVRSWRDGMPQPEAALLSKGPDVGTLPTGDVVVEKPALSKLSKRYVLPSRPAGAPVVA